VESSKDCKLYVLRNRRDRDLFAAVGAVVAGKNEQMVEAPSFRQSKCLR
jgi:hypothetical protein